MLNKIIESCHFLLNNFPEASECKAYLDSRLSEESQNLFQFGYFPTYNNLSALSSLIGEDTLRNEKLLYSKEITDALFPRSVSFSYFEDYPLVMPFKDAYGHVVAIVGRTLLSDAERKEKRISKYKNTVFTKGNYIFGLHENKEYILDADMVYVVEGQFDVIKASEKGMRNIVALGNSNMTAYQLAVITRYTNNIILLLDNDEAGEKGRKRIMDKFGQLANIQNFYLSHEYKDIDECLSVCKYEDISFTIKV